MIRSIRLLSLFLLLALAADPLPAQIKPGTPPFGSFGGGPDVINLASLNSHLDIPVFHKPGRGMDFQYDLTYDNSVWYPVTVNSVTTWQPVFNWGWIAQTAIKTGYLSYSRIAQNCDTPPPFTQYVIYSNFVYHDPWGGSHGYSGQLEYDPINCDNGTTSSFVETSADGLAYTLSAGLTGTHGSFTIHTITTPYGQVTNPPLNLSNGYSGVSSTATDRNGNQITVNSTSSTATFTDTLGKTALSVAGTGSTSSPITLTYTTSTGGSAFYQINYTNYTVATNFGISGIGEYKSSAAVPLVSSIGLPDGSQYSFTYEATPGTCSPYAGTSCVTARVKIITLPTGGTITYTYSGGTNNNGILSDGRTATLTRVTPDGSWTYAQVKGTGAASTTTVTDPANNQTVIQFQGIYETQRKAYQGTAGGTLLQTTNTCYNATTPPATPPCTGTAVGLPITNRTVVATIPGSGNLQSQHLDKFDVYGNTTESDDYDFTSGASFPLLRQTLITYAALGGYLNAFAQSVIVKDGNGTIKSRQDTNYDQYSSFTGANCITGAPQHDDAGHGCSFTARANATATVSYTDPVTPGGAIIKNFTYDSLGNLRSAQLNCCQNKTWAYSLTTDYAYPDSVTGGSSSPQLTTSYTFDLNMGLLLTSTDPNSLKTTLTYDSMGRTLSSQVGSLPATNYTYTDSGTWSVKVCSPIQGSGTACQKSILDNQGRTVTAQLLDGNGTLYSATDTAFDSFGRAYKVSNPYTGSAAYWTRTYFDALGRAYQTTLPDNSSSTINYADNTVTTADPTGKQRKAVADGLGRMTSVYEPDPANNNTLTLQTSYAYNVLGQLTQVTQGSQTRSYVYDALGRVLSGTTPEGGRTCFGSVTGSTCNADGYDSFNNLLKRTDARGVLTSYSYDTLNRLYQASYNVGSTGVPATPTVTLTYGIDSSCNSAHGAGCIGQVITMTDGPGSENYTYNSLEQITQLQKVVSGTTYTMLYVYNLAGELTQITYPSGRVIQQSVDAVGRLCEIAPSTTACGTASSPYATGYAYNAASQMTGFKYGNGIFASLGVSPDRLQLNCLDYSTTNRNGTCTHDSTTKFGLGYSYGAAGSNNGLIASITDSVDTGRNTAYSYDSLYRLSTAVTTGSTTYPAWGLQEHYDRYGNRLSQVAISGCTGQSCPQPSVSVDATTNRVTGSPYAYDANGNMTNDGLNTLVYDAENRTLSATNGSSSGTYTYDGKNLRVKKVSGSTTTVYIFGGSKVIAEYDNGAAPSAPSREYVYGGSALLAKIDSSGTKFYHGDQLSNRLVTNSSGIVVAQMGHFPFGEAWYNASNDKLVFTSYERDSESGNDYAQARYYVSRLARFSSPDLIAGSIGDPQSLNRYSYVRNMPTSLMDPSGMDPCDNQMIDARRHKKEILTASVGPWPLDDGEMDDGCIPLDGGGGGGGGGEGSGTGAGGPTGDPFKDCGASMCLCTSAGGVFQGCTPLDCNSPQVSCAPPPDSPPLVSMFFGGGMAGFSGGGAAGAGGKIASSKLKANLLLSDPDCAEFLKMILSKGGYTPNLDSFRANLNALNIIPDPMGETPDPDYVAHVHGYGVSDTVHVDQPTSPDLPQVLLHEAFHTIAYGISDAGLAQYTTGQHVSPGPGMSVDQATRQNSRAASNEFAKKCDPSKVKN